MNSAEIGNDPPMANNNKEQQKSIIKPKKPRKKIPVTNRVVEEGEILSGPLLSIEEGEGCSILNHNKLMINPGGLIGGRKTNDGVTYFTFISR